MRSLWLRLAASARRASMTTKEAVRSVKRTARLAKRLMSVLPAQTQMPQP
jgi:hypothetical protein